MHMPSNICICVSGYNFLSVFCPPRRAQTQDVGRKLNIEANQGIVHDAPSPLIETPPLALTTQMVSCYLFAIYAYHFEMWILFIPNSIGFILGLLWSSLYPLKASRDLGFLNQWKIQYTASSFIAAIGTLTVDNYPYLSSSIAAGIGVVMCSYPLPTMHLSLKESNPNLLGSQFMNAAMLTCCLAWVIHSSFVQFDIFVLLANVAGVVTQGAALLIRFVIAKRTMSLENEKAPLIM